MQTRTFDRALALLLGLALLWALLPARAAADDPKPSYRYELVDKGAEGMSHSFELQVSGAVPEGTAPALHAGVITLAMTKLNYKDITTMLDTSPAGGTHFQFAPAPGVTIRTTGRTPSDKGDNYMGISFHTNGKPHSYEVGAPLGGGVYLSFVWSVEQGRDPSELRSSDGVLKLGTLTVPISSTDRSDFTLLPWTETVTGSKKYEEWQKADDRRKPALASLIAANWGDCTRTPDPDASPSYYQGWYVPAGENEAQVQTNIYCAWTHLRIRAWSPQYETTLTVYRADDKELKTPVATATLPAHDGKTGHPAKVIGQVTDDSPFEGAGAVKFQTPDGSPAELSGNYTLKISKPSHVPVLCTGLTAQGGSIFPELSTETVVLLCGDLPTGPDTVPDGEIRQSDRAALTSGKVYGKSLSGMAGSYAPYDLDGDGRVDERDLAILTASEHYGKQSYTLTYGKDSSTGGTADDDT